MKKEKIENDKPKKKFKLLKIIGIALLIIIILVGIAAYFLLKTPEIKSAYLQSFQGDIQIYTNDNWQTPTQNQKLSLNDKIKTINGTATLILMEKAIVTIDPNTEIEISELTQNNIKISVQHGRRFYFFLFFVDLLPNIF